jgi:hypothetical protein
MTPNKESLAGLQAHQRERLGCELDLLRGHVAVVALCDGIPRLRRGGVLFRRGREVLCRHCVLLVMSRVIR